MMVQSDLYIRGSEAQRDAIVQMVMAIAKKIGVDTTRESDLNIPLIDVPHEIVSTYSPHDHWVQEHITEEDRPMVHAFFGDRDELFGDRYIAHFLHHYPQEQCHRITSGHHLSEEGAREIVGWIDKNPQFINAQNHL